MPIRCSEVGDRSRLAGAALSRRALGKLMAIAASSAALPPAITAAAGSAPSAPAAHPLALQDAPRGGSLIIARSADAGTLDPQYSFNGLSLGPLYSVYDTLTAVNPETNQVEGVLAESWDISDDGLEYTLHLRQGITFHDGTPFNADAVTFAFDRILGPAKATASTSWVSAVTGAEVIDEYAVKLLLSEPFSPLLGNLASGYFGIPSPTAVQTMGDDLGTHPVGTGRWKFKEWITGESITFVPNEEYVNVRSIAENKGAPYLDELVFRNIPEAETQIAAFETGEVNMVTPPEREVQRFQEDPAFEVLIPKTSTGTHYVEFSMIEPPAGEFGAQWKPPFDDIRLRQAVAYAINTDEILENVLFGLGTRNYGPMPTGLFAYKPEIEEFGYHFDPERAKALLAEAGWADADGDGVLEKGNAKLEVLFWGWSGQPYEKVVEVIQGQLQQVGFKVNLQLQEVGTFLARLPENISDLNFMGWGQTEPDMLRGMTNGTWGVGRYRTEACQKLVTDALKTTDPAERTELYFAAAKLMLADAALVPMYTPLTPVAVRAEVKGLKMGQQDTPVYEDIYIES